VYNMGMNKVVRVRTGTNKRIVMASFRVTVKEYEAIKKHYGGMAGLRDDILQELGAVRDVGKEGMKRDNFDN